MYNSRKLKEIRQSHNMTQKDAASLFNITPATLSHYERGQRTPSNEFLNLFAKTFNISAEELMSILFDELINDSIDVYPSKNKLEKFVFLDSEKMKELPLTELLKIQEYAELIYEKYRKKKK